MKSKRAQEIFDRRGIELGQGQSMVAEAAADAVEFAEEDARKRAIKAFCAVLKLEGFHCSDCAGEEDCYSTREFLKAYDNGQ